MAFSIEQQQETEWCWDAVALSVEHYFDPNSQLTQEQLAVKELGSAADQPWYLQDALQGIGKLSTNPQGFLSFAQIQQQLAANLPVCVHIAWNEGGSHYVVISGYGVSSAGNPQVYVSDPLLPNSNVVVWDYDAFVFAYTPNYTVHAEGTWVDTCLVKP
jgi:hypothetical protein